ncbi:hypothetical protein K1719_029173 [Acacia pycnantha]|nr:hypothetical protein K1719_029173 [Acacia pycnantha]
MHAQQIDESSVPSEAINYMKKIKERVRELEEQNKEIRDDSKSLLMSGIKKKPPCHLLNAKDVHHHQDTISSSETMSSDCNCFRIINEVLPEFEARVLHNQALIRILCEKHRSTML